MSPFAQSMFGSTSVRTLDIKSFLGRHVVTLNLITLVVVVALVLTYIVQVNHAVSRGYTIRDLETHIRDLKLANQQMELDTQTAQSLTHVTRASKMLGLVSGDTPAYVAGTPPSYVLAE